MAFIAGPVGLVGLNYSHNCPTCKANVSFSIASAKIMPDRRTIEFGPCTCGSRHYVNLNHASVMAALGMTDAHVAPISALESYLKSKNLI